MKSVSIDRRSSLKVTSAAVATGYWIAPEVAAAKSRSANDQLNIACIGIGGRGAQNVGGLKQENLVAFCDVDEQRAGKTYEKYPQVQRFTDFRKMFDALENQIDAVVVSTPDHTHFHPSMWALQRGKHLYCEKPMAHNVSQVRQMTELARKQSVATQLGCQRHTLKVMHRSVELIQSGAIGKVSQVHCWIGGDRGMPAIPTQFPKVRKGVDWDLWLGPAMPRPYHDTYCPYGWRFWWDFGTGETGNWGCHILDIPFWALGLKYPVAVEASGPPVHEQTTPKQMTTRLTFEKPDVDLHWYHAKEGPPILKELGISGRGANTLFIGSEGMLLTGFGDLKLLPEEKFADFKAPPQTIPSSPGFYKEWTAACKGQSPATCHFDYSGPLAEAVLLANNAYRAGGRFDWDASSMTATGNDHVQPLIAPAPRKGWQL